MTTHLPKDEVVAALAGEFAALSALLDELDDAEWDAPTPLPGWDVRANVAHVIGTEAMLTGAATPEVEGEIGTLPHVRNDIGEFNERWVLALAEAPPDELRARLVQLTEQRLATLRTMDQESWDADGFTPAGQDSHGRFMRIRVFDCWMHEQDIRDAVGRPGHEHGVAVEQSLDEISTAIPYVVGKRAGVPVGATVSFVLTGPAGRTLHVAVEDRARLVDSLDGPATTTLTMPVGTFTRLAGGRITAGDRPVAITGDEALGQAVVAALGYTI